MPEESMLTGGPKMQIGYQDWERVMILLAEEREWEFSFAGEYVPIDAAFNASTYGPVLLAAVAQELQMRQVDCDLALTLHGDAESLFGARAEFDRERNTLAGHIWRLHGVAALIEQLPRHGRTYQLDPLPAVLPEHFRSPSVQDLDQ